MHFSFLSSVSLWVPYGWLTQSCRKHIEYHSQADGRFRMGFSYRRRHTDCQGQRKEAASNQDGASSVHRGADATCRAILATFGAGISPRTAYFCPLTVPQIIHTLTSGKAPIMGVEWWINDAVKDEAAASCQRINLKTSELRAEVTRLMSTVARTSENVDLMLAMMRRAQSLDQEVVVWMKSLPDNWKYATLCWEDHVPNGDYSKAEVFPGRVDVYNDFWIASVWNMGADDQTHSGFGGRAVRRLGMLACRATAPRPSTQPPPESASR